MKLYRINPTKKSADARPKFVATRAMAYREGRSLQDADILLLTTVDGLTTRELFVKALNDANWLRAETLIARVRAGEVTAAND